MAVVVKPTIVHSPQKHHQPNLFGEWVLQIETRHAVRINVSPLPFWARVYKRNVVGTFDRHRVYKRNVVGTFDRHVCCSILITAFITFIKTRDLAGWLHHKTVVKQNITAGRYLRDLPERFTGENCLRELPERIA